MAPSMASQEKKPRFLFLYIFAWLCRELSSLDAGSSLPHRKFEYKYSFKGPHLTQTDGTVPFWTYGGNAIPSENQVRIASSLPSQKGWMWAKNTFDTENWELEVHYRVSGRGKIGADGLAIWFTAQPGTEGPVYGSSDNWNGLGVFMDSFDNDGRRNNPFILAVVNDGTLRYDHESDGQTQQLGGCMRDFRNKPFPTRIKIEYYLTTLSIYFHSGMSNRADDYEICMRAEHVFLPRSGYFGVSAATGGLADDHDVLSFLVFKLTAPLPTDQIDGIDDAEKQKYKEEFDQYFEKLEKQKEEYRKQHPEKAKAADQQAQILEEEWVTDQEIRNIFEGQSKIGETIQSLQRKLDEIVGRQERGLSLLAQISQQQQQPQVAGQFQQQPQVQQQLQHQPQLVQDSIRRHEVDSMLNTQRDLVQSVRDIRALVNDMQQKTTYIHQQSAKIGPGQGAAAGGGSYQDAAAISEIRDNLNSVQLDVRSLVNRPQAASPGMVQCPPAPPPPNCVTTMVLLLVGVAQCAALVAYTMYRSSKETQAKKFY